jgi:hypothetical protein
MKADKGGLLQIKPLTGWKIAEVAGVAIVVSVEYADSEQDFERGEFQEIPLVLTVEQCFELAAALKKNADLLLTATDAERNPSQ